MNLKEILRPKSINWKQTISTLAMVCLCIFMGFITGVYYSTGALPTFTEGESIAVPEETKQSITEVQTTLTEMPDKEYEFGYNCIDFARDAKRELRWQGTPSLVIGVNLEGDDGHSLLLVPTTDEGWVFIDKQSGQIVRPTTGGLYGGSRITAMYVEVPHWILYELWQQNPVFEEVVNE